MHCQHCGSKLTINGKYCGKCGKSISESISAETQQLNNNETSTVNKTLCKVCGKPADLKYIEFYENRGALVMRYHREIKGNLCKDCINTYFWKFTLTTLFVGWFGVVSFLVTPIYIVNNVFRYLWTKLI